MHHLSDDGPGADDGDFHHEIVEARGLHAREGCHLRATLDLEDTNRVRALNHRVGLGIVLRQVCEVDLFAVVLADQRQGLLQRIEHAETQEIDLDQPEIGTIFFVPLDDGTVFHRRGFDGDDFVETSGRDHDSTGVLAQMPREASHLIDQVEKQRDPRSFGIDPGLTQHGL
jgi:hypothetical protein